MLLLKKLILLIFLLAYHDCIEIVVFSRIQCCNILRILKKGGLWINFGPLTFHFADGEAEGAIELPYDSIIQYITKKNFK